MYRKWLSKLGHKYRKRQNHPSTWRILFSSSNMKKNESCLFQKAVRSTQNLECPISNQGKLIVDHNVKKCLCFYF